MKKNILKISMYIVIILVIVVGSITVLNKVKEMYLGILNSINSTNTKLETISQDIINNTNINKSYTEILDKEVNDSLSDKTIKINLNNEIINLNLKYDNVFYEVNSLISNKDIPILINNIEDVKVFINGEEYSNSSFINIGGISINNNIKVEIKSTIKNDSRTFYIRTMPSDFPEYKLVGESEYEGDYYLTLQPKPFYMMKISNDGKVLYYKKDDTNPFFDFKKHNINGKVRYSYLEVNRNIPTVGLFYELGDIVILDENYNEIDRVTLKDNGEVKADSGVENHDFIMIDDGHYIVSSYELRIVDNVSEDIKSAGSSAKVIASVLQEIKDGKVIWQWDSTDYPQLYNLSIEGNNFTNSSSWQDYVHFNSIIIDEKDNNLVCSFRNLDSVIKLDRNTGDILWILGGNGDQFGLDDEQKFSRQHMARILENGDITIFDNGFDSKKSRVLQISIDEENKKIVDYKEFSVANRFSMYMGSAQKIDYSNNVFVIGWGSADSDTAIMSEVDFKNDKVLSELHFIDDTKQAYRVYKFK